MLFPQSLPARPMWVGAGAIRCIVMGALGLGQANSAARSGVKLLDFRANMWHLY